MWLEHGTQQAVTGGGVGRPAWETLRKNPKLSPAPQPRTCLHLGDCLTEAESRAHSPDLGHSATSSSKGLELWDLLSLLLQGIPCRRTEPFPLFLGRSWETRPRAARGSSTESTQYCPQSPRPFPQIHGHLPPWNLMPESNFSHPYGSFLKS